MTKTKNAFFNIQSPNLDRVKKKIHKIEKILSDPSGAIGRTIYDFKRRAPGMVADEVRKIYNVKKNEIKPSAQKRGKVKLAGEIKVRGKHLGSLQLIYRGRPLTTSHFGMTPKTRPAGAKPYKVKFAVKKGKKRSINPLIGGVSFIAPARSGNSKMLHWLRWSGFRKDIRPAKTISLPQMISNPIVRKKITAGVNRILSQRIEYNFKRALEKAKR